MKTLTGRAIPSEPVRGKIILILVTAAVLGSTAGSAPASNKAGINVILLKKRQFIPEVVGKLSISKITGHAIIQFEEQPDDAIIDILASHQVNVLEWIPRNAVMAYIPEAAQVESIPGIRWVGKLNPTDKISVHLNKSLTKGFILVDVFPDVTDQRAKSIISRAQGKVIKNPYLGPKTYLVRATEEIVSELSSSDEVSWIWPASDAIINGEPVRRCGGAMTAFGFLPNYVANNDGWDGPGRGSASLKYHFVNGTNDMYGEWGIVEDALDEWAKYAQITWTETPFPNQNQSVDIKWATYSHCPGDPFDGPDGIMAHAFIPPPDTSETLAGDLHFDDSEDWDDYCYFWSPTDLYSIALHELGHSLGLGHSSNPDAVMYTPFNPYADCYRSLHQDDINGIRSIYASRCYSCNINVTSPSSISVWECGDCYYITWNSGCNSGNYVKIQLYKGSSLVQTITSSTSDDGSYYWCILEGTESASNYRIKITNTSDSCSSDWSDYFEITCPCVTVTSPSNSSIWECDTTHTINWSQTPSPTDSVDIWLTKGGVWWPIKITADDGSHPWKVPTWLEPDCGYQVRVRSTSDSSCYGDSDTFCITCPCAITVTAPDGDCWEVGEVHDINWISENTSGNVKIELYKDGSLERVIEETWPDTGSYDWSIPTDGSLTGANNYQIKVTDVSNSSCYDFSNNFRIATPPEAQDNSVTTPVDTPVMITLQAIDEDCPDPPAALTYIITSLPGHGDLYDPGSGEIDNVPYSLVAYGNEVEYIPDSGYEGQDSFTFDANDGGVPPGGGNSDEATVSINVTACIFFDDFPSITLDTVDWTETSGPPTVDDTAGYEPNGPSPYSLHLEATYSVISRMVDLSECWSAQLNYCWKRVGTESGDDLYVDYWDGNEWQTLQVLSGGADTAWELNSVELPADALHSEFRVRFRADCDSTDDEWYIDDVCIQCQSCIEPPLLHAEPNTTQGTCNTIYWDPIADANEYYAEGAEDENFSTIDANSGWITDTNYEFCSLEPGQTYWYHVKAWAPFSLKTWLQTSQTDFENDTLTDTVTTGEGDVILSGGSGTPTIDTVSDTSQDIYNSNSYLNCFLITTETILTQIEVYLNISTSRSIEFVVYEGGPSFSDSYNRIHSSTLASSGTGTKFYSSGPISVQLEAGKHYIIGVVSSGSVTIYYNSCSSHSSPSFGSHVGYGYYSGFPSPNAITNTNSSYCTFYHRYTTAQSSGYTSPGDIVTTATDLPADGNWGVVEFNTSTPVDTELTVDVLKGSDDSVILVDVSSGTDISWVTATALKLRANLSTTNPDNTPTLHDWSVTYTDPAFACESDWCNVEFSTQTGPIDVNVSLDNDWMYQNLPGQTGSNLTASVSIIDDPAGNSSYSYQWDFIRPSDVNIEPTTIDGGGTSDAFWTFAAAGCDQPDGLSDSGEALMVRVTVTGNDYGNTGTAEAEFGIALLGDANNNGRVNVNDCSIINSFWKTGSVGACSLRDLDLNCNGIVNVNDVSITNGVWKGTLGQNSVSNPCPLRSACP